MMLYKKIVVLDTKHYLRAYMYIHLRLMINKLRKHNLNVYIY